MKEIKFDELFKVYGGFNYKCTPYDYSGCINPEPVHPPIHIGDDNWFIFD